MKDFEVVTAFIKNEPVERIPCHPLVMRLAAARAGVPFSEYCTDYRRQAEAMIHMAETYGFTSVHPAGWPYCEAQAYGLEVEFPHDDLPLARGVVISDPISDAKRIRPLTIEDHEGLMNRVAGVAEYRKRGGDDLFICGHHEGMFAEYADLRGLENACMDLYDAPGAVIDICSVILDNAKRWGKLQVEAGAHCMSIGDAVCSQIGPELYKSYFLAFHKELTDYYHSLGVLVKIHICGDISPILPDLITTGADIIDMDHLVSDPGSFIPLLGEHQLFCGNLDPVSCIESGTPQQILNQAREWIRTTKGRGIIAGGCELTPDTPDCNLFALRDSCEQIFFQR